MFIGARFAETPVKSTISATITQISLKERKESKGILKPLRIIFWVHTPVESQNWPKEYQQRYKNLEVVE